MGTSRNDRSPMTPPWKMALAVVGTPDVPVSRQSLEIWRAVAADRGEKLLRDFSNRSLAEACRWMSQQMPVNEVLARFQRETMYESNAGLAIDIGRRALARCAAERGDATSFVGELFAEAVSYYISRDLPSYVGARGRIPSNGDAIRLKEALRESTKQRVRSMGEPKLGPREWRGYISSVLRTLKGEGTAE
jgi:hypothetical protein